MPERRNIFLKAAALIRERIPQYAQIEYAETTSSQGWSGFDLTLAAESIEEVAASATVALRGEVATTGPGQRAYISRCPFGVVFGAAPWNAPVTLGKIAARACRRFRGTSRQADAFSHLLVSFQANVLACSLSWLVTRPFSRLVNFRPRRI